MKQSDLGDIVHTITEKLSEKDARLHSEILDGLIEENKILGGSQFGFLFHGEYHSNRPPKLHAGDEKKYVMAALVPRASKYVLDCRQLTTDMTRIRNGLSVVLRGCKNLQDVRDTLPELVKHMIPGLSEYNRTRPEAFTIEQETFKRADYKVTEDLIAHYVANQLLY